MANGTLFIENGTPLTLFYAIWWGKTRKRMAPIYPGGKASYDDVDGAKFNIGFYFQTASVGAGDENQWLVGQAMEVPTNVSTTAKQRRIIILQQSGGFAIVNREN